MLTKTVAEKEDWASTGESNSCVVAADGENCGSRFVIPRNVLAVQVEDGMNGVRYASVWLRERSRMSPTQAKRGLSGPPSAFLDAGREQILLSGD